MVSIETERGGTYPSVPTDEITRFVGLLGGELGSYLIVTVDDRDGYAQAAIAPAAAKAPARFVIEHRDGPHQHYQSFTDEPAEVGRMLVGWVESTEGWRDRLEWTKLSLGF